MLPPIFIDRFVRKKFQLKHAETILTSFLTLFALLYYSRLALFAVKIISSSFFLLRVFFSCVFQIRNSFHSSLYVHLIFYGEWKASYKEEFKHDRLWNDQSKLGKSQFNFMNIYICAYIFPIHGIRYLRLHPVTCKWFVEYNIIIKKR